VANIKTSEQKLENWHNFSPETISVLVVTISDTGKISDGMVSLREYDSTFFLTGNDGHKGCLYTYRYYERQISGKKSGKLEVLNNKYFI